MDTTPGISAPPHKAFDIKQAGSGHATRRMSTDDPSHTLVVSGPAGTTPSVGQDPWWAVGFHLVAAVNTAFTLGYPALILAYLGWTAGLLCIVGGAAMSFYNNCLLGSKQEFATSDTVTWRNPCTAIAGITGMHLSLRA